MRSQWTVLLWVAGHNLHMYHICVCKYFERRDSWSSPVTGKSFLQSDHRCSLVSMTIMSLKFFCPFLGVIIFIFLKLEWHRKPFYGLNLMFTLMCKYQFFRKMCFPLREHPQGQRTHTSGLTDTPLWTVYLQQSDSVYLSSNHPPSPTK